MCLESEPQGNFQAKKAAQPNKTYLIIAKEAAQPNKTYLIIVKEAAQPNKT